MARLHLAEIEDQPWLPAPIRDGMTDYLSFVAQMTSKPFSGFAMRLDAAMTKMGVSTIVDLGSGGGGPAISIGKELLQLGRKHLRIALTDLFPNVQRMKYAQSRSPVPIDVIDKPVDATACPPELDGFRIMCNSFHHLPPELAQRVLADAVAQRRGIAIFEMVGRSPHGFGQLIPGIPGIFLLTPFVRPFRWDRIFFTYVLPVIPLFVLWDGLVSCFRVYSPQELREMVGKIPDCDYEWEIGNIKIDLMPLRPTVLIGTPRKQ